MDNKEALESLKFEVFEEGHCGYIEQEITLAIKALEKQIPKAVKYNNRHGDGHDYYNRDYFNCPACGRRLRNKQKDPYCGRCGQAIDWSEV